MARYRHKTRGTVIHTTNPVTAEWVKDDGTPAPKKQTRARRATKPKTAKTETDE